MRTAYGDFIAAGGDGYPDVSSRITTRNFIDQDLSDFVGTSTPISPSIHGLITCVSTGATPCPVGTN